MVHTEFYDVTYDIEYLLTLSKATSKKDIKLKRLKQCALILDTHIAYLESQLNFERK